MIDDKKYFAIDLADDSTPLTRDNVEGLTLKFTEGLCIADSTNPKRDRSREGYFNNVILPGIADGSIGDGINSKYDERKLRYSGALIKGKTLEVRIGLTSFKEFQSSHRLNDDESLRLQEQGLKDFSDRYAYFSRACGIAAVFISSEGSVFVGKRKNAEGYSGWLTSVAGFNSYTESLEDINLIENVLRESKEEYAVSDNEIEKINFAGVSSDPYRGDVDFVFIASLSKNNFKLKKDFCEKRLDEEHESLIEIPNYSAIQSLLNEGKLQDRIERFSLMYSLRAGLMGIRKREVAE